MALLSHRCAPGPLLGALLAYRAHLLPAAAGHRHLCLRADGTARPERENVPPTHEAKHCILIQCKPSGSSPSSPTPPSTTPRAPPAAPSPRNSLGGRGIGSTEGSGICHSYAPDGRCISLLKILLTNYCLYDCLYCVNRVTQQRAAGALHGRRGRRAHARLLPPQLHRGPVPQLAESSAIPDYTMEQVVEVARVLREEHDFRGYIHLKTIPDAQRRAAAARRPLCRPAQHQRRAADARRAWRRWRPRRTARRSAARWRACACTSTTRRRPRDAAGAGSSSHARRRADARAAAPRFAPAGQSTQMIVGADASRRRHHPRGQRRLYGAYRLRRVYYSAFSPIPDAARALPLAGAAAGARAPALPGRLADALLRLRARRDRRRRHGRGMLSLDIDPKLAWALAHRDRFPVDLNRAPREMLLRVPGLGVKAVDRLLQARRVRALRSADLSACACRSRRCCPSSSSPITVRAVSTRRRTTLGARLQAQRQCRPRCFSGLKAYRRAPVARRPSLASHGRSTPPRSHEATTRSDAASAAKHGRCCAACSAGARELAHAR